jgi:hypothetical protein
MIAVSKLYLDEIMHLMTLSADHIHVERFSPDYYNRLFRLHRSARAARLEYARTDLARVPGTLAKSRDAVSDPNPWPSIADGCKRSLRPSAIPPSFQLERTDSKV